MRQLSRDMECLRAVFATAGPVRRWWLRRRLKGLVREKERLEQHWRRRK